MSEEGGGKIRTKRGHSQSKPYERRKSFLGKFTDTVRDIIAPSWLSDFMKGGKKSSPEKDQIPEQTEESFTKTASCSQNVSNQLPEYTVAVEKNGEVCNSEFFHRNPVTGPPLKSFLVRTSTEKNDNFAENSQQEKNVIVQSSKKRSLGLGGIDVQGIEGKTQLSHADTVPVTRLETNHMDASVSSESSSASADNENRRHGKLDSWTSQYVVNRDRASSSGKPRFDISLFGTSLNRTISQPLSESFHESSFYPGKTMYGGSMSKGKARLNVSAPYQASFPLRQKMKARPVNATANAKTSSTAQKILETLEKMSTPLSDAKKIPVDDTVMRLNSSYSTSSYARPSRYSLGSSYMQSRREVVSEGGPPTERVSLLKNASISKNYQPYTPPVASNQESNRRPDIHLTKADTVVLSSDKAGGKLKNKKFQHHVPGRRNNAEEEFYNEPPNLKTDFTLPASNMPKINFGFSSSTTNTPQKMDTDFTFSSPIKKTPADSSNQPSMNFTFSSPIDSKDIKPKSVTFNLDDDKPMAKNLFQFGSPVSLKKPSDSLGASPALSSGAGISKSEMGAFKSVTTSKPDSVKSSPVAGFSFAPASELKQGSVMDILGKANSSASSSVKTTASDVGKSSFGLSAATELKTGSVMDILGGKAKSEQPSLSSMFKAPPGQWTCDTCMLQNKPEVDKCVACQAKKPGSRAPSSGTAPASSAPSLSSMFKAPPGQWTCDTCMLQNKPEVDKCVACQAKKPGSSAPSSGTTPASSAPSLSSMFKAPPGQWTCDTCMLQNKPEVDKCVACQAKKPGSSAPSSGTTPSLSSMFKAPPVQWTCDTCMLQNKPEVDKCVACQAKKPGSRAPSSGTVAPASSAPSLSSMFKAPPGQWTCDTCMLQNKPEVDKCVACQAKKPGSSAPSSSTASTSAEPFKPLFQKPTGAWDCDTCLVPNKAEATKCIACATPRPGMQPSSFSSSLQKGFSFGQTGFVFGPNSKKNEDNKSESKSDNNKSESTAKLTPFNFGQKLSTGTNGPTTSVETSTTATTGFNFATIPGGINSSKSKCPSGTTDSIDSKSKNTGFNFGNFSKPDNQSDNSDKNTSTVVPFKFGPSSGASGSQLGSSGTPKQEEKQTTNETDKPKDGNTFKLLFGIDKSEMQKVDSQKSTTSPCDSAMTFGSSQAGFSFGVKSGNTSSESSSSEPVAKKRTRDDLGSCPSDSKKTQLVFPDKKEEKVSGFNFSTNTNTSLFKFGSTDQTAKPTGGQGADNSVLPSSGGSVFGFGNSSTGTTNGGTSERKSDLFVFGGDKKDTSASKPFVFGANKQQSVNSVFGASSQSTPNNVFGANQTNLETSTTSSIFSVPVATQAVPGSVFGSTQAPSNAATNTTSSMFSVNTSSAPAFGGFTAATPASSPFGSTGGFGTGTAGFGAGGTTGQSAPVFGVGNTSAPTVGATNPPSAFGAGSGVSTPAFGASNNVSQQMPAPAFGTNSSQSAFGNSGTDNAGSSVFGGANTPSFGSSNSFTSNNQSFGAPSANANQGFNFSATPSFNFGGASGGSSGVFMFGAKKDESVSNVPPQSTPVFGQPSSDGNTQPSMFNPSPSPSGRVIKKATRKLRR